MNHIQLICDIGELNEVFTDAQSIESLLQKIVNMVAKHMGAEVCSIYLFNENRNELVLKATKGLNPDSVNKVRMKSGDGLVGKALKELRPINVNNTSDHPSSKFFPGIEEEHFEAFLAVPILRGFSKIGVLVIQRPRRSVFKEQEIVTLRAVASQLANLLENARLFMTLHLKKSETVKTVKPFPKLAKGNVASEGFALGPARVIDRDRVFESFLHRTYNKNYTIDDFWNAVSVTEKQLEDLQNRVEEKLSDVASLIFTAHLLLLKDKEFVGAMARKIEDGENVPLAVLSVAKKYVELFSHQGNHYVKEKVQDIEDLAIRLMSNLVEEFRELYRCKGHIVIARELFPSDILKLSSEKVLGVVMVTGGVTSHLSILARSLSVPMVIVDNQNLLSIPDETRMLLDAEIGNLYVNPPNSVIAKFSSRNQARRKSKSSIPRVKPQTLTKDGVRVRLMASVNLLSDLKLARDVKCEGVGLYRTEFPFLIRNDFPSEEEQLVVYRQLVEGVDGKEVNFRTLDIGGDKVLSYYDMTKEQNPFLGMRSIRFSLSNREVFLQQIRAMLRAGHDTNIRITFPMISSIEEFVEAKGLVMESVGYLREKKIAHNPKPLIGMMVEVPSVISMAGEFAKLTDFFSIGSNDLVQYMLAVDRTNEKVATFYTPHHPSVLRAIKTVADAANANEKEVIVCGDMAHQEKYVPFFIGAGIRSLSLEPAFLPKIQKAVEKLDSVKALNTCSEMLSCSSVSDISRYLR